MEEELLDALYQQWAKTVGAVTGWYAKPNDMIGGWCVMPVDKTPSEVVELDIHSVADFMTERDAEFIAALHTAFPEMLRYIRDLEDRLERCEIYRDDAEERAREYLDDLRSEERRGGKE